MEESHDAPAMTLGRLVDALDPALARLLAAPDGRDIGLRSHALVSADDGDSPLTDPERGADILLLIGVRGDRATAHIPRLAGARTRALFVKCDGDPSALVAACEAIGVALVGVNLDASWEHVGRLIRRLLSGTGGTIDDVSVFGTHNDLFGLATTMAALTGGLVTIDDPNSRVLAFSPLDESADEIRRISILGRSAPAPYAALLEGERVYERLREGELVDLRPGPPYHRRLAAGVRWVDGSRDDYFGTIWVQERDTPLRSDAKRTLLMATTYAARLIQQLRLVTSAEQASVRALLGEDDVRHTASSLALLGLQGDSPALVAGFAIEDEGGDRSDRSLATGMVTLHASSYSPSARVAPINGRIYVLFAGLENPGKVLAWSRSTVRALRGHLGQVVVCALSDPATGPGELAAARAVVDRILDASSGSSSPVVTIDESRTSVILREVFEKVGDDVAEGDPRFQRLLAHDRAKGSDLVASVRVYLEELGDVRRASERLHIHPNTLRHRLRRLSDVSGFDLEDPDSRLLLELQLRTATAHIAR